MILVIDTAQNDVFLGLWSANWLVRQEFMGGRGLNELIIEKIDNLFSASNTKPSGLMGIIVNAGPGSFTGLRIGISVANAFAYSLDIPIVGVIEECSVEEILNMGLSMLKSAGPQFDNVVIPHYGAEPNITKPKPQI